MPLRFEMPSSTRAALAPYREVFTGSVDWEGVLDPGRVSRRMQMVPARDGLILTHKEHGFWFVPFADLERWRKRRSTP